MSNDKDLKNNQTSQVDYKDLLNSYEQIEEQKVADAEVPTPAPDQKRAPQTKTRKASVSKNSQQQNKRVSNHDLYNHQPERPVKKSVNTNTSDKKGRFYQSLCPYCGKKVGLFRTWMLKNKGDYFCSECGNHSAVVVDKVIVPMAITTLIVSVLLVLLFTFLVDMHIWSIVLIFIPFLIFFCISVFLVRLKKIAPPGVKKKKQSVQGDMQHTRVI